MGEGRREVACYWGDFGGDGGTAAFELGAGFVR
jgi:hypothetical protein